MCFQACGLIAGAVDVVLVDWIVKILQPICRCCQARRNNSPQCEIRIGEKDGKIGGYPPECKRHAVARPE